ncbi:MAG: glycosyltransferase [Sphingobacteriia bacterium]|nr:glycosyltransferase [Sphingobacteriia bacterium]
MSRTRIAFTVINDLTSDQRMERICTTLSSAGYEVTLVGRGLPHSLPLLEKPYRQVRLNCSHHTGKLFYAEYTWQLWNWWKNNPQDIYGSVDADTLAPAVYWGNKRNKPIVWDAHEYFSEVPEVQHRPLIKAFWQFIEKKYIPSVTVAYTVGPALADLFTELYKIPFGVIRNMPFRKIENNNSVNTESPFILYQGALNQGRGLESLIEALPELPCNVKIAGEGDISAQLKAQVINSGVADRIEFLGFVSPQKLKEITPQAFLGYNLLENIGLSYYYSLSNKFFDYAQAGVPSLNNNFPEYAKLIQEFPAGLLLESIQPEKIIKLINELWNSPQQYAVLKSACHSAAEVWNWENESQKLLALLAPLG